MFSSTFSAFGQDPETASPLANTEVVRKVDFMDIEGKYYHDVEVTMKSINPDILISNYCKVKVSVVDKDGKKIWKKTLKNSFLYVFSDGQVQIGKVNFTQIAIKKTYSNETFGIIREKEGLY